MPRIHFHLRGMAHIAGLAAGSTRSRMTGNGDSGLKNFPFSPPGEMGFSRRPGRPEKTTCDGRRSSKSEDPKPAFSSAGDRWRNISAEFPAVVSKMGEVIQFIPKRDLDRARLLQEARTRYESIFPTEKGPASLQRVPVE